MSATKHANKTTPTQPKKLLDGEYYSCILIFFKTISYLYFVSKRFVQTIYTPPNPEAKVLDLVCDLLRVTTAQRYGKGRVTYCNVGLVDVKPN